MTSPYWEAERRPDVEPEHVFHGVGLGVVQLSKGLCEDTQVAVLRTTADTKSQGVYGLGRGVVVNSARLACSIPLRAFDSLSTVVEGLRNTPDCLADEFVGRPRARYGVDKEPGRLFETRLEDPPAHIGTGLQDGLVAFGTGLADGGYDLVCKPLEASGPRSAVAGVGQGLMGFTCKTTAGAFDLAQAVVEGIGGTPNTVLGAVEDATSAGFGAASACASGVMTTADWLLDIAFGEAAPAAAGQAEPPPALDAAVASPPARCGVPVPTPRPMGGRATMATNPWLPSVPAGVVYKGQPGTCQRWASGRVNACGDGGAPRECGPPRGMPAPAYSQRMAPCAAAPSAAPEVGPCHAAHGDMLGSSRSMSTTLPPTAMCAAAPGCDYGLPSPPPSDPLEARGQHSTVAAYYSAEAVRGHMAAIGDFGSSQPQYAFSVPTAGPACGGSPQRHSQLAWPGAGAGSPPWPESCSRQPQFGAAAPQHRLVALGEGLAANAPQLSGFVATGPQQRPQFAATAAACGLVVAAPSVAACGGSAPWQTRPALAVREVSTTPLSSPLGRGPQSVPTEPLAA